MTSDGFLVLAGRDQQQNELLVKRHLRAHDLYLHADMSGAASVVLKNRRGQDGQFFSEVPQRSLAEAGHMALVHSRAWTAKIVSSAWWVRADQVFKTAQTGEYLPRNYESRRPFTKTLLF